MTETGVQRSVETERPGASFAADLRGFGPLGLIAILLITVGNAMLGMSAGSILVLLWVRLSRTPWHEIGYVEPRNWSASVTGGVVLGIALKLTMKSLIMPLLGAPAINPRYHFLEGNQAMLPAALLMMLAAGFGEETFARGYLFERLGQLLGHDVGAKTAIVVLTSGLFAAAHYSDQRVPGVEQSAITGLVFGTIFAITGRILPLMLAHASFDLTAVAMIYWNIEYKVAHFFFK